MERAEFWGTRVNTRHAFCDREVLVQTSSARGIFSILHVCRRMCDVSDEWTVARSDHRSPAA